MPQHYLSLVDNHQIDYTKFIDSQMKEIYLEGANLCFTMSLQVVYLDVSL